MPGQFPGLVAAPDGAGENRIADHGYVWCIFLPIADQVGYAVLRVARGFAMRDPQPAQMHDFIGFVALVYRRAFGTGMKPGLGPGFANFWQHLDVVPMRVGNENVPELELVFREAIKNRAGVEARVKQRRLARNLIPNQVTIHSEPVPGRLENTDFAPAAQVFWRRQPTAGNPFELLGMKPQAFPQREQVNLWRGRPGFFQGRQLGFGYSPRLRRGTGRYSIHRPRFANDITQMILKRHRGNGNGGRAWLQAFGEAGSVLLRADVEPEARLCSKFGHY